MLLYVESMCTYDLNEKKNVYRKERELNFNRVTQAQPLRAKNSFLKMKILKEC